MPFFLVYIASYLGITWGIYRLFKTTGEAVKPEVRRAIGEMLKNADLRWGDRRWLDGFLALFDLVFTEKHLSLKCFWRSSVVSTVSIILMYALAFRLQDFIPSVDSLAEGDLTFFFKVTLLIAAVYNILPDYVSLLETRFFLRLLHRRTSAARLVLLLVADAAMTIVILVCYISLVFRIQGEAATPWEIWSEEPAFAAPIVLTSFVTSIWLWLYCLSAVFLQAVGMTSRGLGFLRDHLDVEEKPFQALGYTAMLLVTLVYVVWGVVLVVE